MEHISGHFQPKVMTGIWNIIEKSNFGPFWPNLGKTRISPQNLALSLFYLYGLLTTCKVSEKISNSSPVITTWRIKWSDWPRAYKPKNSRRMFLDMWMVLSDFLQYGGHFRTFSAKSNDRNLKCNRKGPFLGHFCPILGKTGISPQNLAHTLFHLYGLLTSCKVSEKISNSSPVMTIWRILQSDWPRATKP